MATNVDLSVIGLLRDQLETRLRDQLLRELMASEIKRYEGLVRPIVEAEVRRVTLAGVEAFRDLHDFGNELQMRVRISINGKETDE